MRTEHQVLNLLNEANPVPDIDTLELVAVAPSRYLANLEDRSREMDNREETRDRSGWVRFAPLAVAAILIVVVGVAWAILSNGEPEAPIATEPPTTSVPQATSETFTGYWEGGPIQVKFDGNQYFVMQGSEVVDQGTFSVLTVSQRVTFRSNSDSLNCTDAAGGTFEYIFTGADQLRFSFASDDCDFDRGFGQGITLSRTDAFNVPPTPTQSTEPESDVTGPNGFDVFSGQTGSGRYETLESDFDFRTTIFDSDGSWNCTRIPCSEGFGNRGVFEVKQREVSAAFVVFSDVNRPAEQIVSDLASNSEVIVGDVLDFEPDSSEAGWTALRFTLTPSPSAPTNSNICGDIENLPCAKTDLVNRLNTWNSQTAGGGGSGAGGLPTDWVVTSPQTIWLISRGDGGVVLVSAYFASDYVPSDDEVSEFQQAAEALVASVIFP